MKLPNIREDKDFQKRSVRRRLTFKSKKISSKIRLIRNAFFNDKSGQLCAEIYIRYIDLCLERLKKQTERYIDRIKVMSVAGYPVILSVDLGGAVVVDENYPNQAAYIQAVQIVEQEIEDNNPTIH